MNYVKFFIESDKYPFRALALNDAYQVSLSTALLTTYELQLSDPQIEQQQRKQFIQVVKQKEAEYELRKQEKQQMIQTAMNSSHHKRLLDIE